MSLQQTLHVSRRKTATLILLTWLIAPASTLSAADISSFSKQPDEWFRSPEGRRILDNVLTWQNPNGGWWKSYDPTKPRPGADKPPTRDERYPAQDQNLTGQVGTFDNKATWSELRLLARAVRLTKEKRYEDAFSRGLQFVFAAQYPSGGWPQRYPLEDNYGRHITFNDEAMVEVMRLVRDVARGEGDFAFVSADARGRAKVAFDKGVECILNCQIKVNGQPTVWCAQHDEKTLAPAKARAYELPSFSGGESASIAMLLMEIDQPPDALKQAVRGAALWYERNKLTGIKLEQRPDKNSPRGYDVIVVKDPNAPPLWARFYDLETGKPFFVGRDGVKKSSLAEIELERRAGYAWLRPWGEKVLAAYPKWAAKHGMPTELSAGAEPITLPTAAAAASATTAPSADRAASTLTVAADGSGDFKTVQAAIDAAPRKTTKPITIQIKPGTYKERVRVPKDKPFITLLGDDAKTTILTYDLHAKSVLPGETKEVGTSGSYSTLVEGDDFTAENITFENPSGHIAQAVALRLTGQRQAFFNCRMLGGQDTLYLHDGLAYFKDCYIEGRVDFIFGRGVAAFEDCHIHSKNGGYVTAAATEPDKEFGYLFLHCKLTGDGDKAFLGRPWRPHAAVAFVQCELGDHIRPEGWDNWRKAENEKTARYVEFGNTGKGADTSKRVPWAKQLTADEAKRYTVENVLGGWKPPRPSAARAQAARAGRAVKIVLVGDSTVTDGAGWGAGFKSLLASSVQCVNLSQGGRSSKSYRNEGWWDKAMAERGDYVLIQFGHNDQPGKGPERETDPRTDFPANMKRYVEEARSAGAKPILVTSLTRRNFNPDGQIRDTLGDYADATRAAAAASNAPLIDLHARSIALCESLGPDKCAAFNPPPGKDGRPDVSHLNAEGSRVVGALVAGELVRLAPELASHVKAEK